MDVMLILILAEFSGIMGLWWFIEHWKYREKNNSKKRVNMPKG